MKRRTLYTAAAGAVFDDGKAQDVGEELEALPFWPEISVESVVDLARDADSALHPLFEWRDVVAAESYRRQQARHILNHLITETEAGQPVRVYHSTSPESGSRRYVHLDKVRTNPQDAGQVIEDAVGQLEAWRERFNLYQSILGPLWGSVEEAIIEYRERLQKAA